jgi:hypothetical protein
MFYGPALDLACSVACDNSMKSLTQRCERMNQYECKQTSQIRMQQSLCLGRKEFIRRSWIFEIFVSTAFHKRFFFLRHTKTGTKYTK